MVVTGEENCKVSEASTTNLVMKDSKNKDWLDSKAACKELKVSACDLSHIRGDGKLRFLKVGNAFMYSKDAVEALKRDAQ